MTEIIRDELYRLQDREYRDFHTKLIPTVAPESVIGVRMPRMKELAKSLEKAELSSFLSDLPHKYYDENVLHGLIVMNIPDYVTCIEALEKFLPYVDNWAVCDLIRPPCFKKHRAELIEQIKVWLRSEHTYTLRFGMEMLMCHFLDEDFQPQYIDWVSGIKSREYYVNMMVAWYFATALAKQWETALPYIEGRRLETRVHNKSIQKALESYRLTDERKAYLRKLKNINSYRGVSCGNGPDSFQ